MGDFLRELPEKRIVAHVSLGKKKTKQNKNKNKNTSNYKNFP